MSIIDTIKENRIECKIGLGCFLSLAAFVSGVCVAPKALDVLDELKEEHKDDEDRKGFAKDVVKKVGPMVAGPVILEAAALGCIISGTKDSFAANAALAAAYSLSESAYRDYREKTKQIVGDRKELQIREEVSRELGKRAKYNPSAVVDTGYGSSLMYDTLSQTFIRSGINIIDKKANEANKRLFTGYESYITVNEWLYELGIEPMGNVTGNLCFTSDRSIEPYYTASILEEGKEYIIINYRIEPGEKPGYDGSKH